MSIRNTPVCRRGLLKGLASAPMLAAPAIAATPPPPGLSPALLASARAAFERHRAAIGPTGLIAIADYGRHSSAPRFFLFNPGDGRADALRVAHGRGSDPAHTGWLQRFSAQPGSAASSQGAYLTADIYTGQHGRSRRLIGLDPDNRTAFARAIVIHGAWYCEPGVLAQTGKLGRSEGCFAFSAADNAAVLAALPAGSLLFSGRA